AATLSTCKTTLPMAAYSSRPDPRTGRRGRVANRDGHAGQQEVGAGAQRAASSAAPPVFIHAPVRQKRTRHPERYRRRGSGQSVNRAGFALPSGIPRTQYPPPEAAGKLVSRGADNHMDVGSAHRIFRGLRSGPAPRTPAGRLDKAGHRTGARAVPPKQYGGPQATTS